MLQHGNMPLKTLIITNCKFLIFDEPAAAAGHGPGIRSHKSRLQRWGRRPNWQQAHAAGAAGGITIISASEPACGGLSVAGGDSGSAVVHSGRSPAGTRDSDS